MICMKCRMREKKVSYISLAYQTYKSTLLSSITPFIFYHIFMDMNVQGKNGIHEKQQKKSLTKICFYRFYFPLLGMLWNAFIYNFFFLLGASTFFFFSFWYVTHIQTMTKKGNWKKGDCELWGRMKKEKWNEIKFLRCGGKTFFLHTRKWAYPFILFVWNLIIKSFWAQRLTFHAGKKL